MKPFSHFEIDPDEEDLVIVTRRLVRESTLPFDTRGFICYLLSHEKSFHISMPWIMENQGISKNLIYRMVNQAIEAGYLKRIEWLDQGKKRYKYIVARTPKFKNSLLCPQKQDTENEDRKEFRDLSKDKYINREEERDAGASPPEPPPPLLNLGLHVKLSQEEYEKFCSQEGKSLVDEVIHDMDGKIENGTARKPKKNKYTFMLTKWISLHKKWEAERKAKTPEKANKHFGFQQDTRPVDPKRVFDFS
jgi:hypothetical protein